VKCDEGDEKRRVDKYVWRWMKAFLGTIGGLGGSNLVWKQQLRWSNQEEKKKGKKKGKGGHGP